jgi:hypothetical protein
MPTPEPFDTYAVDPLSAWRVVGLTDRNIYLSDSSGCSWRRVLTLDEAFPVGLAPGGRFTAVTVLAEHGLLAVADDGARTRVVASDSGEPGTWSPRESGLPPAGVATALAAASSAKVTYLAFPSVASLGGGQNPLPGPKALGDAPILFGSTDNGHTWSQRRAAGLDRPVTQLVVDEAHPSTVYARSSSGPLRRSSDNGGAFQATPVVDAEAMAPLPAGGLVAFGNGRMYTSTNGGSSFSQRRGPPEVVSTAVRADERQIVVELPGARLGLLSLRTDGIADVTPSMPLTAPLRTTGGRVAGASTFQSLSGASLLRYVDDPDVAAFPPTTRPPRPGSITPGRTRVEIGAGRSSTVAYQLALPPNPSPLDVFYLIDITSEHDDVRRKLGSVGRALASDGVDVAVGLGVIGSRPRDLATKDPPLDPTYQDQSGANRPYQQPRLYKLARRIGPPDRAFDAATAAAVIPETYSEFTDVPVTNGDCGTQECANLRPRGQWISLDQLMTGNGVRDHICNSAGNCHAEPTFNVPPGQVAGWRQDPNVRRVVVMGTPGEFSFRSPPGSPDGDAVTRQLIENRVRVIGMSFNSSSWLDLRKIVVATGGVAGERLVDCGPSHLEVPPGQPLVCGASENDAPEHILGMLRALPDVVPVGLDASAPAGLVQRIDAPAARAVDVTVAQRVSFLVTYSCADRTAGTYPATIAARLRGSVVATTQAEVVCGDAPAVAPPVASKQNPAPASPPAPATPQLPPPAPAAPTAAAQVVQPQVGVAEALRSEQQLQLAIASAEAANAEQPPIQLAMTRRRDSDDRRAHLSFLVAAVGASGGVVAVERRRHARQAAALRALMRHQRAGGRERDP